MLVPLFVLLLSLTSIMVTRVDIDLCICSIIVWRDCLPNFISDPYFLTLNCFVPMYSGKSVNPLALELHACNGLQTISASPHSR